MLFASPTGKMTVRAPVSFGIEQYKNVEVQASP